MTGVEVLPDVDVALVDRRPVGEAEFLALHVDGRILDELQAAGVVVVQVRLDDVADALGVHAERVQPGAHVVAGTHDDLVQVGCVAEPAARVVQQSGVRTAVEEHAPVGMLDQVEEVRHVDRRAAVRVERVEDRAERLLAAAVEGEHLHGLVSSGPARARSVRRRRGLLAVAVARLAASRRRPLRPSAWSAVASTRL